MYGLDLATGQHLWSTGQIGTPFNPEDPQVSCADLIPDVGITSTPVVDTDTDTVYLVSNQYVPGSADTAADDEFVMHRSIYKPVLSDLGSRS